MTFDKDLFDYYKMLVRIRKDIAALRRGDFTTLLADDTRSVYAFRRSSGDSEAIVVINNGGDRQSVDLQLAGAWEYLDELNRKKIEGKEHLRVEVAAKSGLIFVREK